MRYISFPGTKLYNRLLIKTFYLYLNICTNRILKYISPSTDAKGFIFRLF